MRQLKRIFSYLINFFKSKFNMTKITESVLSTELKQKVNANAETILIDSINSANKITLLNSSSTDRGEIRGKPGSEPGGYLILESNVGEIGGGKLELNSADEWISGVTRGASSILESRGTDGVGSVLGVYGSNHYQFANQVRVYVDGAAEPSLLVDGAESQRIRRGGVHQQIASEAYVQQQISGLNPSGFVVTPIDMSSAGGTQAIGLADVGKHLIYYIGGAPATLNLTIAGFPVVYNNGDQIKLTFSDGSITPGHSMGGCNWMLTGGWFAGTTVTFDTNGSVTLTLTFWGGLWNVEFGSPAPAFLNTPYTAV